MDKELKEVIMEKDEIERQLSLKWTLENIKYLTTGQLTMNKWDTFTDILKEYYLEEFSTMTYIKRKQVEELMPMKQIILETA